jgi:hypothetical protein
VPRRRRAARDAQRQHARLACELQDVSPARQRPCRRFGSARPRPCLPRGVACAQFLRAGGPTRNREPRSRNRIRTERANARISRPDNLSVARGSVRAGLLRRCLRRCARAAPSC